MGIVSIRLERLYGQTGLGRLAARAVSGLLAALLLCGTATAQDAEDGAEARILAAREYAQRGDLVHLEQLTANPGNHPLEPYVGYWLISGRIARISDPLPPQVVRDYLRQWEGTQIAERARSEWLKRLGRESNWALFNEEYPRLQQPDAELQCYAISAGGASTETAQRWLESQWLTLGDTPDSCFGPLRALVDSGRKTQDDVYWRLLRMAELNKATAARQALSMISDKDAPDAASLTRVLDRPDRFLASPQAKAARGRGARALVLAAIARNARNDPRGTLSHWRSLDENRYTATERAWVIGEVAWGAAIGQMNDAVSLFASSREIAAVPMSDEQLGWNARAAMRLGNWSALQAAIEAMGSTQRALPEWTYWLGRALSEQNRAAEAAPLFERFASEPHFYGILCAEALGRSFVWPLSAVPPTPGEIQYVENTGDVRRAMSLLRIDMRTEALREWAWGMRGADDRFLLSAAEYARRMGFYDRAINAADRTKTQHDYSLRYLAPFYDVFARESAKNQVDLHWVYAITRQESRFQIVARSPVGAQGLMQLMPATARTLARQLGMRGYNVEQLAETNLNIQLGTAYLRNMLDLLSNSPVMATAAYNAGPGRAKRWRDGKPMEGAIYAETIPIPETRDYVKKVMANTVAYAVLLEGHAQSLTRLLGTIPADNGEAIIEASR